MVPLCSSCPWGGVYDEETLKLARYVNRFNSLFASAKLEFECKDLNFDYDKIEADLIINCSCEHMYYMKDFDLKGTCVFQSNNFRKETAHINCVDSVEEFIEQSGISPENILYKGERPFHRWDDFHKRFMIIGNR